MTKLLFASLLTVAIVFAQADGGTTGKSNEAPANKPGTTKTKKHSAKSGTESAHGARTGEMTHLGFGSGAGKVSGTQSTKNKGGKKGVNKAGQQPPAKRPEAATPAK